MNTDIRISVSFINHRKRLRLEKELGNGATGHLLNLWLNTAMNHPLGRLEGMDATDVALEAGWNDDPQKFVEVLQRCGFLETDNNGVFVLHEWEQHQPYAVHALERSEKARKASEVRWHKPTDDCGNDCVNATSILLASSEHAKSNAPSPSPSPKPEEENASGKPSAPFVSSCPFHEIKTEYNTTLPELPQVEVLTESRQREIQKTWEMARSLGKYEDTESGITYWRGYFQLIRNMPYLMGSSPDVRDGKLFRATFDWLINTENYVKIIEGKYAQRKMFPMYGQAVN